MKKKGILGAAFATAGVVFPSVVIITAIALVLRTFMDILWVQYAFSGIRVAVIALIVKTVITVTKKGVVKPKKTGTVIITATSKKKKQCNSKL